MATFPSYVPTDRRFAPGTYPQRVYRSLAGVTARRTFGDRPYGASLELNFNNVSDAVTTAIINHYRSQTQQNKRFKVSNTTMGGLATELQTLMDGTADNLRWEYSQPPDVESVRPGLSRVSVSLTGEIRDPNTDD